MKVEIKVPPVGESVVEATVGVIFKPNGSVVKSDEEILELETDKVNQAVYAPVSGTLHLTVATGNIVSMEQVIGFIDSDGASAPESPPEEKPPSSSPSPPPPPSSSPAPLKVESEKEESKPLSSPSSPYEVRKKMSKLRQVIAARLVEVKNQTAMLTTFNEVDLFALLELRANRQEAFQSRYGVKLGFMSFFVKATIAALREVPELNARIEGDEIVYSTVYNIGIAVGTDKGLFVPVFKSAEELSSAEIEQKLKEVANQAREGALRIDQLQGGTFTITNGGVYGSMLSTPILNPPQSGILGMHAITKRAIVIGDEIQIRPMMYLALSYDHRIVDGKGAIGFLAHLKKSLEEPTQLLEPEG